MSLLSEKYLNLLTTVLQVMATLFIFVVGTVILFAIVIYFIDKFQKRDSILKNHPLMGRFRGIFITLGRFFRQYFFAMDREELPFNRTHRNWVDYACENKDTTMAFGSTKDIHPTGTILFAHSAFPTLAEEAEEAKPMVIGPNSPQPYEAQSYFNISGMSFGALSAPSVRALSSGAKKAGCWMNTGEGGLSSYHLEGGADIVFQIGTARYGVRDEKGALVDEKLEKVAAHPQVKMIEIKLSQGAKPGKGGILPGIKVTAEIAKIRHIPEGQDSISPNRHPEVKTVQDLLDFIARVKKVSGLPVGFKTAIGGYEWLNELCEEIKHRGIESAPDFITIDSGEGGSGAAPLPLIDNVGLSSRESLPGVIDLLREQGLREHIRIISSGKLVVPSEVAWALATGADFCITARGYMFALGCVQAMQCNRDTCPVGVTTHNKKLQRGLVVPEKAGRVANYHAGMLKEVGIIAHACGVREPRELRRHHARIVMERGMSIPLNELYGRD